MNSIDDIEQMLSVLRVKCCRCRESIAVGLGLTVGQPATVHRRYAVLLHTYKHDNPSRGAHAGRLIWQIAATDPLSRRPTQCYDLRSEQVLMGSGQR